jgi:thiol-disulfide isomerase/thioredoxin
MMSIKNIALGVAVVGVLWNAPPSEAAPKIAWQKSFESAQALAKKTGKPMFVDFWAEWCLPCLHIEKFVFPQARVVQASRSYIPVRVDTTKRQDLVRRYGFNNDLPALAIIAPSGKLIKLRTGLPIPQSLIDPEGKPKVRGKALTAAMTSELAKMLNTYKAPAKSRR